MFLAILSQCPFQVFFFFLSFSFYLEGRKTADRLSICWFTFKMPATVWACLDLSLGVPYGWQGYQYLNYIPRHSERDVGIPDTSKPLCQTPTPGLLFLVFFIIDTPFSWLVELFFLTHIQFPNATCWFYFQKRFGILPPSFYS